MTDNEIINRIEEVRTDNNANWMDLLRLALKAAPIEAKTILRRVNMNDAKISALLRELAK